MIDIDVSPLRGLVVPVDAAPWRKRQCQNP